MPAFPEFTSMALNQTARNGSPSHSPARPRLPSISEVRPHSHSHSHSHSLSQAQTHSHSQPDVDDSPHTDTDAKRHLRVPRSRIPWTGNGYSISRAQSSGIAEVEDEAESEGPSFSVVVDSHRRPESISDSQLDSHHRQHSSTSLASTGYAGNNNSPFTTNPHSKTNSAESDALPSFASLEQHIKSRQPPSWSDEALLFKLSGLSRPYRQTPGSGSSSSNNLDADRMPSLLHHLTTPNDSEGSSLTDRELMHRRTASAPQPMEPFDPHSSRADRAASRAARAPTSSRLTPQATPDQKFSNIEVNDMNGKDMDTIEEVFARQRSSSLYRHNPSPAMPRTPYSRSPDQAPASLVPFSETQTVQTVQTVQTTQSGQEHHHRQSIESNDSEPNFFELGNFRDVSEADGDKCVFVNYCGTGSKPRKAISHFFGRNKTCTRQIREYVWVHWCRKHYQRTRYEQKANYPLRQAKLLRAQIERVQIWGDQNRAAGRGPVLVNWTLALRKREQDRIDALKKKDKQERADMALGKRKRDDEYSHESSLPVNNANAYPYDENVDLDDIPTHAPEWLLEFVGREYDTQFLLQLIDRIEGEINKGALPMIPDIEMLPNFEDPSDTSSKKKKPTKRRQTTARRTPLGHRQTQSVSGPIMHSAAHTHGPAPSSSFDYRQPYPQQPAFSQPHYQSHQHHHSHAGEGYNWHSIYSARPEHDSHAHAHAHSHNRYHSMGNLALAPSNGNRILPAMDASSFDRPQYEHGYPPAFEGESREPREPRDMPREPRAHQRSQSEAVSRFYPGHPAYTSERRMHLPPLHTMSPSDMRPASPQSLLRHARHHSLSSHMSMPVPGGHDGVDERDERPRLRSVHA